MPQGAGGGAAHRAGAGLKRRAPGWDNCRQGYVWRQSDPSDHVCVTPETRTQTQSDTAESYDYVDQNVVTYGPNTCKIGYVWRSIDDKDYVCVSYASSAQAQADDAAAGSRHEHDSDRCIEGYVWREAFPKDHVCVTREVYNQTQSDNADGWSHVEKHNS